MFPPGRTHRRRREVRRLRAAPAPGVVSQRCPPRPSVPAVDAGGGGGGGDRERRAPPTCRVDARPRSPPHHAFDGSSSSCRAAGRSPSGRRRRRAAPKSNRAVWRSHRRGAPGNGRAETSCAATATAEPGCQGPPWWLGRCRDPVPLPGRSTAAHRYCSGSRSKVRNANNGR